MKPEVISVTSFRHRFNKGFDVKCRGCGSQAKVIFRKFSESVICDVVIRCPKCRDNQIII